MPPTLAGLECLLCSHALQSTAQQTLRFIRTKEVEYPSFLSPEAVDFLECSLVRWGQHRFSSCLSISLLLLVDN